VKKQADPMVDDLVLDKNGNFVSGTWFCPNGHANDIVVRTRIIWVALIVGIIFILIGSPFTLFQTFIWPAGFFFLGIAVIAAAISWSVVAFFLGRRKQEPPSP
jgi:hypothetical protein